MKAVVMIETGKRFKSFTEAAKYLGITPGSFASYWHRFDGVVQGRPFRLATEEEKKSE